MEQEEKISQEEGKALVQLARNTLQTKLSKIVPFARVQHSIAKSFPKQRGVFVGIWLGKTERGCMGIPWPNKSLGETVQEVAINSAFGDARYAPLRAEELPQVKIEVTVLTTPKLIEPDQIQLGIHGLIIHRERGSGLLLPHVSLENGWDIKTFLAGTCLKGNLSAHAWKEEGGIYAFEVQVFKET